jgi:hypothetical protein
MQKMEMRPTDSAAQSKALLAIGNSSGLLQTRAE